MTAPPAPRTTWGMMPTIVASLFRLASRALDAEADRMWTEEFITHVAAQRSAVLRRERLQRWADIRKAVNKPVVERRAA